MVNAWFPFTNKKPDDCEMDRSDNESCACDDASENEAAEGEDECFSGYSAPCSTPRNCDPPRSQSKPLSFCDDIMPKCNSPNKSSNSRGQSPTNSPRKCENSNTTPHYSDNQACVGEQGRGYDIDDPPQVEDDAPSNKSSAEVTCCSAKKKKKDVPDQSKEKEADKVRKEIEESLMNDLQGMQACRHKAQSQYQEKLCKEDEDACKIAEELKCRERIIQTIDQRIAKLQCDLAQIKPACPGPKPRKKVDSCNLNSRMEYCQSKTCELEKNVNAMTSGLQYMIRELGSIHGKNGAKSNQKCKTSRSCHEKPSPSSHDCEIEDLKQRLAKFEAALCAAENKPHKEEQGPKSYRQKADLEMLRKKCRDLMEDHEQFKLLLEEQSTQLDTYRKKYIAAQQMTEEQKCTIESLERRLKVVEMQKVEEICRMREKFEEQLKELSTLPKLLECERKKLAAVSKEKCELQQKLTVICQEYEALMEKYEKTQSNTGGQGFVKKLMAENEKIKALLKKSQEKNKFLRSQVDSLERELASFRIESMKLLARNKECANTSRAEMQRHINVLEVDLAQCRASSTLMIAERDDYIKKMKRQLNVMSCSFEKAQDQVSNLKCQIDTIKKKNC